MVKPIPFWILVWTALMGLLPLVFGLIGYFNPGFFGAEWAVAGVEKFGGPYGAYVGRNMASVAIIVFALWQRSVPMIIVALLMRMVSDVFDVINNVIAGTVGLDLVIPATILITGCTLAIRTLWGRRVTG